MRTLGKIIRKFFCAKGTQIWLCVPSVMETKEDKDKFIMDTINFLQETIKIRYDKQRRLSKSAKRLSAFG